MNVRVSLLVAVCVPLVLVNAGNAQELSPTAKQLLADVKYLASDELEGRGVGTEGLIKAADFIAEEFRKDGLNVVSAGGDPYQEFQVTDGAKLLEPNTLKFLGPEGQVIDVPLNEQFQVCSFGAAGTFEAPLVFAGYGIEAADVEYDDFATVDVKDKVVIILRRTPFQADPHSAFAVGHGISRHAALTTKVSRAFSRGAVAVLFVNDHFTGDSERQQLDEQLAKANDRVIAAAEALVAA
ncbi:MAG: aminopeptidase, partial [Planctomycetaceae bacterium]|nr:aminopeptidase [Planctomycetaceae bacterium]